MRGAESGQDVLFSYVSIETRIPRDHPLRTVRRLSAGVGQTHDAPRLSPTL